MTETPLPEPQPAADTAARIGPLVASRLAGLSETPVADHADVYQLVHADLQAALAEVDGR